MNPKTEISEWRRWWIVVVYATAMAWVESAVVYYLRTMIDRIEPYQPTPLPIFGGLAKAELVREAATLVMLWTVGWLAGRTWRSRVGYFLLGFGVWDIFYYVFLKVLTDWPRSLTDWDILFLLPLPWWGPVIAPMAIAGLMIAFGTIIAHHDSTQQPLWPRWQNVLISFIGAFIALYVFMADAIRVVEHGEMALRNLLPVSFNWPLFLVGLSMMSVPVVEIALRVNARRRSAVSIDIANQAT